MAFREAKKLLQAQLAKERSIPEAAEGEGGTKHISAEHVRSPSPGPEEGLPGNAGKIGKGARSSVGDGAEGEEKFQGGEIQSVEEEDVDRELE